MKAICYKFELSTAPPLKKKFCFKEIFRQNLKLCEYSTGLQVIEKFIRKAHRLRYDGENMTYEASTFMYAIAVSIFAIGGMCGGFIGGWIANKFGRKGGLLVNNLVGIVAAMV